MMDDEKSLEDSGKSQIDPLAKKKKVGNYLLGKVIGEGSFSKVRHSIHIIAKERVAVKIVSKKAVLLRDYVKKGVRREAVLLQKLHHPNIVRLYEIMETENSYYLVLELAESGDFIKYLSEKIFLDEFECQKYIRQMTSALDHMHTSNITQRGICMYAMLTGKLPFVPEPNSNLTLLHARILKGAYIPDMLSEGCSNLLSKMLKVDVHQRIRIDDIMRHRWVLENQSTPLLTRQPPIGKLYPHVPKAPVVNYMTNVFTFLEDDIFYSVIERKMNAVAATYHLLQKRFDAGHLLVGSYSMNNNAIDLAHGSFTRDNTSHTIGRGVELPQLRNENTFLSEAGTKGTANTYKSYLRLLKDSNNRSAHVPRTNSLRQKDLFLRRYKTRTETAKYTRTQEESTGILNDFVLTYTKNERINQPQNKIEGAFEWEQTFIYNKPKRKQRPELIENIKYGRLNHGMEESNLLIGDDLRGALHVGEAVLDDTILELKAPPTTPATLFVDNKMLALNCSNTRLHVTSPIDCEKDNEGRNDSNVAVEGPSNEQPWSSFHRQKTRLARGVTLLNKKSGNVGNVPNGIPITQPKLLTPRDSKVYMDDLDPSGITGHGRKLVDRSKTFGANVDDLHSIWTRNSRTASSQRSSINQDQHYSSVREHDAYDLPATKMVDANGVLQLPQIISQPPPLLNLRPPSPPKRTIIDGVTDVIKIHITGSAKH